MTSSTSQPSALLAVSATTTTNAVVTKQEQKMLSSSVVRAATRLWVSRFWFDEKKEEFAADAIFFPHPALSQPLLNNNKKTHHQSRALATPLSLALVAASTATSYVARALAAAGCPPEGYVTSLKVRVSFCLFNIIQTFLLFFFSLLFSLPTTKNKQKKHQPPPSSVRP